LIATSNSFCIGMLLSASGKCIKFFKATVILVKKLWKLIAWPCTAETLLILTQSTCIGNVYFWRMPIICSSCPDLFSLEVIWPRSCAALGHPLFLGQHWQGTRTLVRYRQLPNLFCTESVITFFCCHLLLLLDK
jgi:hypothetical protein